MTVNCLEAMAEVQASDRVVAPASGASAATIESLRARLLSERAASKEARQHAHSIAQRVSELQIQLDAEIGNRRKAEAAMNEVFKVLTAKGLAMERFMANIYLPSEGSASEEAAPIRGSRDENSDQSCGDQSSGEEASAAHMDAKHAGSTNSQGSADNVVLSKGWELEHQEGSVSSDSSSDKTQIILEKTSRSDTAVVGKEGVSEHEEGSRHDEQGVLANLSEGSHNDSLSSTAEVEKDDVSKHEEGSRHEQVSADPDKAHRHILCLSTEEGTVGKEGVSEHEEGSRHNDQGLLTNLSKGNDNVSLFSIAKVEKDDVSKDEEGSRHEQVLTDPDEAHHDNLLFSTEEGKVGDSMAGSFDLFHDLVEHAEGDASNKSSVEGGQIFTIDVSCPPSANPVDSYLVTSSDKLSGGLQMNAHDAIGVPCPSNVETMNGMPMLVPENFPGPRPTHAHSDSINGSYPYDVPVMYADRVYSASPVEASLSRGLANFSNTAYCNQELLSSKVTEVGRYPKAPPISDAILSLVDDRNGKLGSILMALQLAKQQLEDEEQASAHEEEKLETVLPMPANGKHYPGFHESVQYQAPYHPRKPEPHKAAPIVHFPMSPTSNHEVSPFERHDGLGRSMSTFAYYMSGYDPHEPPKGELHPAYYMSGNDPYEQPKGELHLGNGITLYTD